MVRPIINLVSGRGGSELILGEDIEMNEPLKLKMRSRVMSERLDDDFMFPEEARRKTTEMAIECERKDSFI